MKKWIQDMIDNATAPDGGDTAVIERPPEVEKTEKIDPVKPPMYAILLHNDDTTFPTFVIRVIEACFGINSQEAAQIMGKAHFGGKCLVKVVSREIAETEVAKANEMATTGQLGQDHGNRQGPCELTFSFAPESAGE